MWVYAGQAVQTTVTFKNPTGVLADPTTVVLKFRSGGTTTTYTYLTGTEITRVSTGKYQATLTTAASAVQTWTVEWIGTGTCAAVGVSTFRVAPKPI